MRYFSHDAAVCAAERAELLGTIKGAGDCAGFANVCWRLKMAVGGLAAHLRTCRKSVRLVRLIRDTEAKTFEYRIWS